MQKHISRLAAASRQFREPDLVSTRRKSLADKCEGSVCGWDYWELLGNTPLMVKEGIGQYRAIQQNHTNQWETADGVAWQQ